MWFQVVLPCCVFQDELSGLLPSSSPQFLVALKSLAYQLPTPNFRTCGLLMQHLHRWVDYSGSYISLW